MKIIIKLMQEKRWLAYGSCSGGAIGALAIHFNEALPHAGGLSFGLPMGMALALALGMIGGMIGGVVGSFLAGMMVKEKVAMNVGESLGIGLLNGFIVGTAVGAVLGLCHIFLRDYVTPLNLFIAMAALIIVAVAMKKFFKEV